MRHALIVDCFCPIRIYLVRQTTICVSFKSENKNEEFLIRCRLLSRSEFRFSLMDFLQVCWVSFSATLNERPTVARVFKYFFSRGALVIIFFFRKCIVGLHSPIHLHSQNKARSETVRIEMHRDRLFKLVHCKICMLLLFCFRCIFFRRCAIQSCNVNSKCYLLCQSDQCNNHCSIRKFLMNISAKYTTVEWKIDLESEWKKNTAHSLRK